MSKEIYTTGANVVPMQLSNGKWAWVVQSFEDDSYSDGEIFNPISAHQDNLKDLIRDPNQSEEEALADKVENF